MNKNICFTRILYFIGWMYCINGSFAQNTFVKHVYDERDFSKPRFFLFIDTVTNMTDTFDIHKHNPFINLKNEVVRDFDGTKVIRITRQEFDEIVPHAIRANYFPDTDSIATKSAYLLANATKYACFASNPSANPVVAYSFLVCDASGELFVGATAYYYILDRYGKIIHISKSLGVDINAIYISEDNRYIGFHYGSSMNNEYISCGVRVYEAFTDSIIFDIPFMNLSTGGFVGSKFLVEEDAYTSIGGPHTCSIYFLDATTKEIGKYTFPSREAWLHSGNMRSDRNGIYFENMKGEKLNLLFDRDFIKTFEK
jgi:hypothetical protein